mgnify:CR=1 FL=1
MNSKNITILMNISENVILLAKHDEPGKVYWLDTLRGAGSGPFSSLSKANLDWAISFKQGYQKLSLQSPVKANTIEIDFVLKRRL